MTREDAGVGHEIRALTVDDLPASWELTRIAFGSTKEAPPGWLTDRPGRVTWGVFDERGRLVAKAMDRNQGHWFGGRLVPATGLAGVVAACRSFRGTGLGRMALTRTLHAAHERGAVIATLFRSGPGPYRSLGCEEAGALTWVAVPATAFAAVERPRDVALRAAEVGRGEDRRDLRRGGARVRGDARALRVDLRGHAYARARRRRDARRRPRAASRATQAGTASPATTPPAGCRSST